MVKRPKKLPHDLSQLARSIVEKATGGKLFQQGTKGRSVRKTRTLKKHY